MDKFTGNRAALAVLIIFVISLATIIGAWGFEIIGGFKPCPLCLTQRISYYIAVPLAGVLVVAVLAGKIGQMPLRAGAALLALILLAGGILGGYHAGVEWGWWPGPDSCTGGAGISGGLPDLSKKVVMCDEVQLRILGLSFAGWNAVVSGFCALVGLRGALTRNRD